MLKAALGRVSRKIRNRLMCAEINNATHMLMIDTLRSHAEKQSNTKYDITNSEMVFELHAHTSR